MKIGYVRVSTEDQNTIRQELLMKELGVDEVYIDRLSGKSTDRPSLKAMLSYVRNGDTVIVSEISRFARNTRDLLDLIEQLNSKGVEFVSKKEAIDTTTPTGKFMLTIFGAVAELEREYILERQREGIAAAKSIGKYKGRRPKEYADYDAVMDKWTAGEISAVQAMITMYIAQTADALSAMTKLITQRMMRNITIRLIVTAAIVTLTIPYTITTTSRSQSFMAMETATSE